MSLEKVWSAVWKHHGCGPAVMLVLGRTTSISLIIGTLKSLYYQASVRAQSISHGGGCERVTNNLCSDGVVSNASSYVETPCG